ncbi:MAG: radical SAM family heme chaperone HemW [Candidatus Eisenbacteria bacterium]|nr:radical SAM family heme chaperone HemW [Candidatus Latescibacterota bacterium]MBD3301026.1 radical SAM family heme chaperone HemW [Candidatus Eisenbacteria bacterium]
MPAGLYVHVPFCKRRCGYCDFYVETGKEALFDRTVDAILREAAREAGAWAGSCFDSLFVGGGTPSLLGRRRLGRLLDGLRDRLPLLSDAEITIEANPESTDADLLAGLRAAGMNRLSLGVQSFADPELRLLDRLHDAARVRKVVEMARAAGVPQLSLDLIYGIPGTGAGAAWRQTLDEAIALVPDHLSCYLLSLEERTPMGRRAARGELHLPGDAAARAFYDSARQRLEQAGYEHYEISNWSRPGRVCRHNVNVWRGGVYLGLGPGAHGYDGTVRRANLPDLIGYLSGIEGGGIPPREEERIDERRRFEERLLLGLRLREGVAWREIKGRFGEEAAEALRRAAAPWVDRGFLACDEERLRIEKEGWFVSNRLVGELITGAESSGACRARP